MGRSFKIGTILALPALDVARTRRLPHAVLLSHLWCRVRSGRAILHEVRERTPGNAGGGRCRAAAPTRRTATAVRPSARPRAVRPALARGVVPAQRRHGRLGGLGEGRAVADRTARRPRRRALHPSHPRLRRGGLRQLARPLPGRHSPAAPGARRHPGRGHEPQQRPAVAVRARQRLHLRVAADPHPAVGGRRRPRRRQAAARGHGGYGRTRWRRGRVADRAAVRGGGAGPRPVRPSRPRGRVGLDRARPRRAVLLRAGRCGERRGALPRRAVRAPGRRRPGGRTGVGHRPARPRARGGAVRAGRVRRRRHAPGRDGRLVPPRLAACPRQLRPHDARSVLGRRHRGLGDRPRPPHRRHPRPLRTG